MVRKLPRLILAKNDGTVYFDLLFLKADKLREKINKFLAESSTATDTAKVEINQTIETDEGK